MLLNIGIIIVSLIPSSLPFYTTIAFKSYYIPLSFSERMFLYLVYCACAMCAVHVLYVCCACAICVLYVYCACAMCVLYVYCACAMCTICVLCMCYVYYMCTVHVLCVYYMCMHYMCTMRRGPIHYLQISKMDETLGTAKQQLEENRQLLKSNEEGKLS